MNAAIDINAFKKKMRSANKRRFHAGSAACPTDCPPGGPFTMSQLAAMSNRKVAGASGACQGMVLPLTGTFAEDTTDLTQTFTVQSSPVGLCVDSIVAIQNDPSDVGAFVLWSNLTIRNSPQWIIGELYDEALFAPDAECSCCLPLDCIEVGASVSVTATIPAAAIADDPLTVALYLIGRSVK